MRLNSLKRVSSLAYSLALSKGKEIESEICVESESESELQMQTTYKLDWQ